MQNGPVVRPLIGVPKLELRQYAVEHKIGWHEDKTNADLSNPRNFLRHELLVRSTPHWRSQYLEKLATLAVLNKKIDQSISSTLQALRETENSYRLPHELVRDLPLEELEEVLMAAARSLDPASELDRRLLREIALFAKTAAPFRERLMRKNLAVAVQSEDVRVYYMGISKVGRR